jgi:hypothetical protein
MSNRVKEKLGVASNSPWNLAIKEVERHLTLAKRRVVGLEKTVQNWKKLRDEGMPWPGQLSGQSSKQDHSV